MIESIGRAVQFRTNPSGDQLDGWYLGEIGDYVYIALDEKADMILQCRGSFHFSDSHDRPRASFASPGLEEALKHADELEDALETPMRQAMDRLDYNRLRRFVQATRSASDAVYTLKHFHQPLPESGAREIGSVLDAYEALLVEVDRSGILELIAEYGERILRVSCSELHLFGPGINDELIRSGSSQEPSVTGLGAEPFTRPTAGDHAAAKAALGQLCCPGSQFQLWPLGSIESEAFWETRLRAASALRRLLRAVETTAKHLALGALGDPPDLLDGRLPPFHHPFLSILSSTCVGLRGAAEAVEELRRLGG